MAPAWSVAITGLLATVGDAVQVEKPKLRGAGSSSLPIFTYRSDCFTKPHMSLLGVPKPGSGMDPSAIQPFQEVLKDGFYEVDCVKDYMFEHGDKFGDNRFSYKLGDVSGVSIVHYSSHVPKEDRKEMTHETCFLFCRTVPDMLFFGLTNGRECYCAPYYKAEADDSSQCDAPCDGNPSTMCGGKSKSSIFAMHSCQDTAQELTAASTDLEAATTRLAPLLSEAKSTGDTMQALADGLQNIAGKSGDASASDLLQTAKVEAGDLLEVHSRSEKVSQAAADLIAKGKAGETDVTKAEELTAQIEASSAATEGAAKELDAALEKRLAAVEVAASGDKSAADLYYPLMYFVDKTHEKDPSTCSGKAAAKPVLATQPACARLCDKEVSDCVGFSFVPNAAGAAGGGGEGLCFLLANFDTVQYYTDCQAATEVKCYAKLSKFEGTSLAPKGDGTCKNCLKEAKKASRCFTA